MVACLFAQVCSDSMAHEFDLCLISGDHSLRRFGSGDCAGLDGCLKKREPIWETH